MPRTRIQKRGRTARKKSVGSRVKMPESRIHHEGKTVKVSSAVRWVVRLTPGVRRPDGGAEDGGDKLVEK